ncbi:MAG: DUF2088 domain-containing protein [Acidobacteria bacterium]|nr:DUF2088 domain-containing protein [Acidobacteriota bacterium]
MSVSLIKIRQFFDCAPAVDPAVLLPTELRRTLPPLRPGARVAVAVGSRGIHAIDRQVRIIIDSLRDAGAEPFLVPAMGSHGGATADGQAAVLASLGLDEAGVGAPVRSSMATVELPDDGSGRRVFMDRLAWESDGVVLVNRVKPHTDFRGLYESGLVKMAAIGLGKHDQAREIHRHGVTGLRDLTPAAARRLFATGKILLGVAIVENARDEPMLIRALGPHEILDEEPALLELARQNMPALPVDRLDVLLLDEMGKNISGTGLDPNIIGRIRVLGQPEPERPAITQIAVCGLTPESHGNAIGVGLADVITRRLFDNIDLAATYANVITTTFLERAKIPLVADTPAAALRVALMACGPLAPEEMRIIRLHNTLQLEEMYVSHGVLKEQGKSVTIRGQWDSVFDGTGELRPF